MNNQQLLEEAKRRYPIGTKFYPAHSRDAKEYNKYCIVVNEDFIINYDGDIVALTNLGGEYIISDCEGFSDCGNTTYSRIVYNEGNWAEIIELGAQQASLDTVNPPHYKKGEVECIEAIRAATIGKTGIEAVCVANVLKYLWRYEDKGGMTDVEKGLWYLNKLVEELKNKQDEKGND